MNFGQHPDNISIADIQRRFDIFHAFLIFMFFIVIVGIFLFGHMVLGEKGQMTINSDEIYVSKDAEKEGSVKITAEVPYSGGVKLLGNEEMSNIFTVYGNYSVGFLFINKENGEVLYRFDSMPGDGIIVRIPSLFEKIIFSPLF